MVVFPLDDCIVGTTTQLSRKDVEGEKSRAAVQSVCPFPDES